MKPRESQYGCSQFVVVKDDTGEMGSNINIENEEAKYQGGEYIQVKGKVSHYVKGNKPNISLNGNVIDEIVKEENVSQEKPITKPIQTTQEEYTKDDYWRDKAVRDIENNKCIVRECAIKAVTELAVSDINYINNKKEYFGFADEIVDYINKSQTRIEMIKPEIIMSIVEESIKEFGGTVTEETKEERIAKAQEIANPNMASKAQKDMVEKIIKSRYITKEEVAKIGDLKDLTKVNASRYISYWFGDGVKVGERAGREMIAQEEEEKANPFATTLEKVDKDDDSSLSKDVLIEQIQKLRKENALDDDAKFTEALGCNANFKLWHESELTKLKEKLEIYKPNWVTEP